MERLSYPCTQVVRIAGKQYLLPAVPIGEVTIVVKGTLLRVAEIHDEFFLESCKLPEPEEVLNRLRAQRPRPDLFTFAQKLPDFAPRYSYPLEWDHVEAMRIRSYKQWLEAQISRGTKRCIAKAYRKGVTTRVAKFDEEFISGICSIYNELPVRQGKPFWHYGKARKVVEEENATFLKRSRFLGAYYGEEMIGFIKLVIDGKVASLLQILSKRKHSDKSPTNALLAKAVELCEEEGLEYLTYDRYIYGIESDNTLIDFKRHNGFIQMSVPRYTVPLTIRGMFAFRCGLHHGLKALLPSALLNRLIALRAWYYRTEA